MKGVNFVWGQEQQDAFESLKRAISQPPVLRMADFSEKFILQTDTSGVALGGQYSLKKVMLGNPPRMPPGLCMRKSVRPGPCTSWSVGQYCLAQKISEVLRAS